MKRMQIKLYGETEEQEQVLAEFKLKREMQRTKLSKSPYTPTQASQDGCFRARS